MKNTTTAKTDYEAGTREKTAVANQSAQHVIKIRRSGIGRLFRWMTGQR